MHTRILPRRRARLSVEAMEARHLLATFVVLNINDAGDGSLRQAILDANTAPGTDAITFAIPGTGPQTIHPITELPTIIDPVSIDGFSQPGARPNTQTDSDDAIRLIGLDGEGLVGNGLHIASGGSTVRGLAITRFVQAVSSPVAGATPPGGCGIFLDGGDGNLIEGNSLGIDLDGVPGGSTYAGLSIRGTSSANTIGGVTPAARNIASGNRHGISIGDRLSTSDGNLIAGNFLGPIASGTLALGNIVTGLNITGSSHNTIGGAVPGAGNVISGNGSLGLSLANSFLGPHSNANLVQGNFIGTDASGMHALGNGKTGVVPDSRSGGAGLAISGDMNTIGGSTPGAGNLISGNLGGGIYVQGHLSTILPSTGRNNLILGNRIGTDASGIGAIGNGGPKGAIDIAGTTGNTVGGLAAGDGNIIAFNGGPGVKVFNYQANSDGNVILSNVITSNTGLGIELSGGLPGVSDLVRNVPRPPVLNSAVAEGGSTTVSGTLASVPGTTYILQFFADGYEFLGPAEGRQLLGAATATTDASGNASFTATLPGRIAPSDVITATATNEVVGSSGFSGPVDYVADLAVTQTAAPGPITAGADWPITLTVTNTGPMAATGVVLVDALYAGTAFVSSSAGHFDPATNILTAPLGTIPAGGSATVLLVIRPTRAGTVVTTASVKGLESDPTPDDNASAITTAVMPDGPQVMDIRRFGNRLVLVFNDDLNPRKARDKHAYVLVRLGPGSLGRHRIPLRAANYRPRSRSVTLRPAERLHPRQSYVLIVRGIGPHALAGAGGLALDGGGNGQPGTNDVITLPGRS